MKTLSERHESRKTMYCMIPFIRNVYNMQFCKDRKQISGCLGLGGWEKDEKIRGGS